MGHKTDRKARARRAAKAPRPLPATWQGAKVVRGEGMNSDALDTFLERLALDEWSHNKELYLLVEDKALQDIDNSTQICAFANERDALIVAKARSHGNVDHRVLKIVEQTLVVATMNDL